MDELHRRILQTNRSYLVSNIEDIAIIVDYLYEKDVLTEGMRQDILQGENTTVRQVRKLLDILPKRGPFAFSSFCNALILHKHRHVAEHLDQNLINQGVRPLPPTTNQNVNHPTGYNQQPAGVNNPVRGEQGNRPVPNPYPQPMTFDIHKQMQNSLWEKPHGSQKSTNQKPGYGRHPSREVNASQPEDNFVEFQFPQDWPDKLNMAPFNSKDFDVDSCEVEDVERVKRKNSYRMCSPHRGRAIIINNQEFSGGGEYFAKRSNSEMDSNRLQQVLQKLAFQVHIWRDVSYGELIKKLQAQKQLDHNDAFILVILSYGGEGTIFCEDGKEMTIQEIVNIFSAEKCQTLDGKPKLIFVQACGTKLRDVERRMPEMLTDHAAGITKGLQNLTLGSTNKVDETDTNPGNDTGAMPPIDANDMLVAMATSPDTDKSSYGSIFMLALAYVFCHCSKNQDLETMLHRINQLQQDPNSGRFIKLCEFRSCLRQKLYFLPGYPLKGSDPKEDFPINMPTPSFGSTKIA